MTAAQKAAHAAKARAWRAANPERVREIERLCYVNHIEERRATGRKTRAAYVAKNREAIRAAERARYHAKRAANFTCGYQAAD